MISNYRFKILVTNHASDEILERLFNKNIEEIKIIITNNIKEIYNTIDKIYNTLSTEELNLLIAELQKEEVNNHQLELIDDIKEFQDKNNLVEIGCNRFIEMLEYLNIKVPKACYTKIEDVANNGGIRAYTKSKSVLSPVYNAIDKLMNYKLETL